MKSLNEIVLDIRKTFSSTWKRERRLVVPETQDVALGNVGGEIEGAVLYADIRASTELVHGYKDYFAAAIYKSFLGAACAIVKNNEGTITSFDGDRVMAVFAGECKCSNAAKTALQIFSAVKKINEEIRTAFPSAGYQIGYAVGVDVGNLYVIRTGVRGDNDLAWIGDAANIAAKLSEIRDKSGNAFITERVFHRLSDTAKFSSPSKEKCMWVKLNCETFGQAVYGSTWYWNF